VKRNSKNMAAAPPPLRQSGVAAAAGLAVEISSIEQSIVAAQQHWNVGQNQQAETLCLQVLTQLPSYPPALHLLGLIAHTVGKLPEAAEFMRAACASPEAPALFHSNFAEMCRQSGNLADAERAARLALALDPLSVAARSNLGIILQEAGQLDESLVLLRQAIAAEPDQPEFHNSLGNTLSRKGLLLEAKAAYSRAIALHPEHDSAYANLSGLLSQLGDHAQGLAAAQRAIDINPQCIAAYLHAASIHLGCKQFPQAMRRLDALLSFMPEHAQAWQLRAELLAEADEPEEALQAARQALAFAPHSGDAALALARVLQAQGWHEEALAMFAQASRNQPTARDAAPAGQAALLIELGRNQEALSLLEAVLARSPRSGQAWLHLSTIKKFAPADNDIARMEAVLADGARDGLPLADDIALNFALGKAHMDGGKVERALDAFDRGNGLQRALIDYDAGTNTAWMAAIAQQVPSSLLRAIADAGAGDPSEMPIFIVGMPRSGTTLVEQILASHPEVVGAGELSAVQGMVNRIVGPEDEPLAYPALMSRLEPGDFTELGTYYVETVAPLAHGKRRLVDKMPLNFMYAGLIHLMLPNARIIHTRRDPVDTCMSCYCQAFEASQKFTFDLAELGEFYAAYAALMQHWRTALPPSRLLEINYEDVVGDLDGSARRMIEFCGLGWDDACLEFHRSPRRVRTASMAQVRQPIYRSSMGRWQPHADRLAPLLERLGLSPGGIHA
jgi:tetratricopeptide (TPR) repeat protein